MFIEVLEFREKLAEARNYLDKFTDTQPEIAIILGTGLGGLANEIEQEAAIPYKNIPNFPVSTVHSHEGKLIFGKLSGKNVVALQGRFHYYEGYTMREIVFPTRVMRMLGAETLFVSNACGSLNPYFRKGNIMLIDDHINMLGDNPLIGPNDPELGPRFPDMSRPYTPELIEIAERVAIESNIFYYKGVYVAMQGPMLETRAEYRMLRRIGADVVGMSTVPEIIAARHMGMKTLGFSVISDECYPDALAPVSLEEIIEAAGQAEPNLTRLIKQIAAEI